MPLHLLIAADHPWRLDFVSLAGILAAVGTGILAFFTWRLANETRDLARETEEDVSAEWRPVLIEHQPPMIQIRGGEPDGVISTSLRNDGRGPAINCWVTIESRTSKNHKTTGRLRQGIVPNSGESIRVDARVLYRDPEPNPSLRHTITAEYQDLSGRAHKTVLTYEDPEPGRDELGPHAQASLPLSLSDAEFGVASVSSQRTRKS